METNESNVPSQEPAKPVEPEKQNIVDRFKLNESEQQELWDEAHAVKNIKDANVTSLEILYWEAQATDPVKATELLGELERRGKIPELLETERREIETKRSKKTEKEIASLRERVRNEPRGVSENLSKMLKLKNVQMPSLFDTRTNHAKLMEQSVKKLRDANKKEEK